jgi:molecular chaperone Hsp33
MDLLTTWIDRSALLRIAAVDATRTARSLCMLHDLEGPQAKQFSQILAGALVLASELKELQTLSLQVDLGESSYHVDATAAGLVRAMATSRSHPSTSARVHARRLGTGGVSYESVVQVMSLDVDSVLEAYMRQSEQQVCRVHTLVELDAEKLPSRVRGAWLRGFPGTPNDLLESLFHGWEERKSVWNAASPWVGLPLGPWDALGSKEVQAFCPCDRERAFGALVALGPEAIEEARTKGEEMEVVCDFCRTRYAFKPDEVAGRM